ncbi:hypothetical protein Fcan01_20980 [Folsomia candida]|uniref:Uncharacterized protein n=1 Tax=Folsomia candida TaxID=158441 RepID=A0A226DIM4_FOLCA|nr:hypothetical protein Fcan01_20980 [Folsomia candida]
MKFVNTFGIYCAIFILLIAPESNGKVEAPPAQKSCKKWIFNLLSVVLDAAGPCVEKSLETQSLGQVVTRIFCFVKCLLNELAVLNEDGAFDQFKSALFFAENFPETIRNELMQKAGPCFKVAEAFNGTEYYCKSYAPFSHCVVTIVIPAMTPHVLGCFGTRFITAGLNAAFGFLINQTRSDRLVEIRGKNGRLRSPNNRTLKMLTTAKPKLDKRKGLRT